MKFFKEGKTKSKSKKDYFQGSGWWIQKGMSFDRELVHFLFSVLCWQNRTTLTYRILLLCVMMITNKNRRDVFSMLMKKKNQNLLEIATLHLKQSDIWSCCLVGKIIIYSLEISLKHSIILKWNGYQRFGNPEERELNTLSLLWFTWPAPYPSEVHQVSPLRCHLFQDAAACPD